MRTFSKLLLYDLFAIACLPVESTVAQTALKPFSVLSVPGISLQGVHVTDFVTGDFNGDGKVDTALLVNPVGHIGATGMELDVFLGNGDGSFQQRTIIDGFAFLGGYLNAGDFNGDGKLDLAVLLYTGYLEVYIGKGDGTFASPISGSVFRVTQRFFVADVNRDGKLDLIAGGVAGWSMGSILIGNGNGTFQPPVFLPILANLVIDVNHDGNVDIVGGDPSTGALSVLLGCGDGTFQTGQTINSLQFATGQPGSYQSITSGDFNGDGNVDLVVAQESAGYVGGPQPVNMAVLFGNGDGTFQAPKVFTGLGGQLQAADLNQDGKLDLVSNYSVLLGNGDGTFSVPLYLATPSFTCQLMAGVPNSFPSLCPIYSLSTVVTDVNGDGLPDLVTVGFQVEGYIYGVSLLSSFVNNSPGDGFLTTGISSTGGTGLSTTFAPYVQPGWQAISIARGPGFSIGQNSLVTAYGVNLAPSTASATGGPYPTTLGGIRLHIGDSLAQLLYVSPSQINYIAPQGPFLSSTGGVLTSVFSNPAISIERVGTPFVQNGLALPMVPNAPGLFVAGSSGVAAASAVRVASSGTQTPVPVVDCSTSPCTAVPIDLSGDPVFLSLYGTGMNYVPSEGVTATVTCGGGSVVYLGPPGVNGGLDQVNILLAKSSSGIQQISCELVINQTNPGFGVDVTSNPVHIAIQ